MVVPSPIALTHVAVAAFTSQELSDIALDIVISEIDKIDPTLDKLMTDRGNVVLHSQLTDLADLMVAADLAIGAGGSTTWERCVLGLPTILVVSALNQEAIGKAILESGAGIVLFPSDSLSDQISDAVLKLKTDKQSYEKMSEKAAKICDGTGAQKISLMLLNN